MSYKRLGEEEARLRAEVKGWLEQAEAVDQAEDAQADATKVVRKETPQAPTGTPSVAA